MKKIVSLIVVLALIAGSLAACSQGGETTPEGEGESTVIKIGASATPHAEILEQVKDQLAEAGYTLEIIQYDDYVLPNQALADGTLDANYFQHLPYLNSYNEANGTDLISAAMIHYEPFGIYGNEIQDLADLKDGTTIILPADDSNETRALLLLQQEGLIKLAEGSSAEKGVTTLDVLDDGGYDIVTVQADTVAAQLKNSNPGTIAVINGNYALEAGLKVEEALALEDASGDAAITYSNIIAVRSGDESSDKIQALIQALETDEVKAYIEETYGGAVVAIF